MEAQSIKDETDIKKGSLHGIWQQYSTLNYTATMIGTFLTRGLPSWPTVDARVVAMPWSIIFAWSDRSPVLAISFPRAYTDEPRT